MKIGVIGCAGRMGKNLVAAVLDTEGATLSGGVVRSGAGADIGVLIGREPIGLKTTESITDLIKHSDAVIEFTTPTTSLSVAEEASKHGVIHVSGTTGFSPEEMAKFQTYAKKNPIIWSTNMSIGVNLLNKLVRQVASTLDESFDIEIVEMHHRKKVDSPSGTALTLGEMAAAGRNAKLSDVACKSRDGITGERKRGEIGFATLRGGDVIGDHTVIFAGAGERIELSHKATNRTIYATGAVRACLWAKGRQAGFYSMQDVLS